MTDREMESLRQICRDHDTKQKKAATLKLEYEAARREALEINHDLRVMLTLRAREDCLKLTEIMYRKLPAELRECIYHYICIDERPILVGPYYHHSTYSMSAWPGDAVLQKFETHNPEYDDLEMDLTDLARLNLIDLPDGTMKEVHDASPPSDMLMPTAHIFNARYMGDDIASEACAFYLKHNTFSVCHIDNGISSFLTPMDFLDDMAETMSETPRNKFIASQMTYVQEMDISPGMYVSDLQVRIKYEHFGFEDGQIHHNERTPACGSEAYALELVFLRQVYESLFKFWVLQSPTHHLRIEFVLMTAFAQHRELMARLAEEERMLNLMETIREALYELKYNRSGVDVKVTHHDAGLFPFPRDITSYYNLSKQQWTHERSLQKNYSPFDYYVAPGNMADSQVHRGFTAREYVSIREERWGLKNIFSDKAPTLPIKEGKFWPSALLGRDLTGLS